MTAVDARSGAPTDDLGPDHIAVVVPVFDDRDTLDELHARLATALDEIGRPYRLLYVHDAGAPTSWSWIRDRASTDRAVRGLRLARNVGQTRAICVGFEEVATAGIVATIDADLDFEPEALPELVAAVEAGADLAAGIRFERSDQPISRSVASRAFNLALRVLAGYRLGDAGCGYFAMTGALTRKLPSAGHRRLAIRPLIADLADNTTVVPVRYRSRPGSGISSLRRARIAFEVLAVDARPGAILAGAGLGASAIASVTCGPRLRWLPGALLTGAGVTLVTRHVRLRRSGRGSLGAVAERVG